MVQQININSDPTTPGIKEAMILEDPLFPGIVEANINADPTASGVIQVTINFNPLTPGILFFNINKGSAVIVVIPANISLPVISGTPQVGQTLTTTNGTWTGPPTSFTYQWKSAGVNATGPGATTSSYTAVSADIGNTLTVVVTATNTAGSTPATSAATGAVTAASQSTPYVVLLLAA